jgi:hypothetical protein
VLLIFQNGKAFCWEKQTFQDRHCGSASSGLASAKKVARCIIKHQVARIAPVVIQHFDQGRHSFDAVQVDQMLYQRARLQ